MVVVGTRMVAGNAECSELWTGTALASHVYHPLLSTTFTRGCLHRSLNMQAHSVVGDLESRTGAVGINPRLNQPRQRISKV